MKAITVFVLFLGLILTNLAFAKEGAPWLRTDDAVYKNNKKSKYIIFASLNTNPAGDYENTSCDDDWSIDFDLSEFTTISGFDVDRLYVDSTTSSSAIVLNRMLDISNDDNGRGRVLLPLQWNNWHDRKVSFCVGNRVTHSGPFGLGPLRENIERDLKDLILWYDNSKNPIKESEIPKGKWARSGNLSWYPYNQMCQAATFWRRYDTGQIVANANTQSVSGYNVCSANNVLPECVASTPTDCGSQGIIETYFQTGVDTAQTPQPDQGHIDPATNHKHAIGLHYVKYKMSGQKNWHKGEVTVDEGTNQKLNIRVKVKEKESRKWSNIYVDLYHSENRWFSRSHDTKIDTKKIKKLGKKEKESRYFHNINISNLPVGHHYYFADIRYGSKHNISSRSDKTEFVVVNVQDVNHNPKGYVDSANCDAISGWVSDEDTTSPLNVHIYDGNTMIANIYADDYRSDVGSCGFTYVIPENYKDGTRHNFRVFAINEPQGQNPVLTNGSFHMSCGNNSAVPVTRFYNSRVDAQFYSVKPTDQTAISNKYPDWRAENTTFNAFPNSREDTVPLYTCWTGSTHDFDIDITKVGDTKPCKENPWRMFDVYPVGSEGRTPVYLMYKSSADSYILSNGLEDGYFLRDTYGFQFTDSEPLFWTPAGLITQETVTVYEEPPVNNDMETSVDEAEEKNFNQASYLLLQ